jgi:hypothetical protein
VDERPHALNSPRRLLLIGGTTSAVLVGVIVAARVILGMGASLAHADGIFSMPVSASSAQETADKLSFRNVEQTGTFAGGSVGITCHPGESADHWVIGCHAEFVDTARDDGLAALDFLIYDSDVNFDSEDAYMTEGVAQMPGRWHISDQPEVSVDAPGGQTLKFKVDCHQALGSPNQRAFCLLQATPRVLVLADVLPAQPTTESIDNSESGTFQDTRHAAELAALGAMHVVKSLHP